MIYLHQVSRRNCEFDSPRGLKIAIAALDKFEVFVAEQKSLNDMQDLASAIGQLMQS